MQHYGRQYMDEPVCRNCGHDLYAISGPHQTKSMVDSPGMYPQMVRTRFIKKSFPIPNLAATAMEAYGNYAELGL